MMGFAVSDELLGTVAPIVVYWLYSGIYVALSSLESYRLHSKVEEEEKNLVSKASVVKGVLVQQVVQAVVAILLFTVKFFSFPIFEFFAFVKSKVTNWGNFDNLMLTFYVWNWMMKIFVLKRFDFLC